MKLFTAAITFALAILARAQVQPAGVTEPIAQNCPGFNGSVVCVNRYAAVLPYHFNRSTSININDYDFRNTSVGTVSAFHSIGGADFLVFNQARGLEYLGSTPSYKFVFNVSKAVHEAPVYVAAQNKLYISQLAPGLLPQLVVDLNQIPPTLSEYTPNPPVYAPSGGTFYNGQILFGASGGDESIGGGEQRVSLRTVNPATNQSTVLLNNYFGFYFNMIDDVAVHPQSRQIFFTDPDYSWFATLTDTAPQLPVASYRFDPATGATILIDDTIEQPNGIAFTPDGKTLYISDTGALTGTGDPRLGSQRIMYNTTGKRTIYSFDVTNNGTRVSNKRAFYLSQDWIPDGLKVSEEGLVLTASGHGVDVLDPNGQVLIRVQTNYTVQNFAWTGTNLKTLWLMGNGGISKVEWNITGQTLR